MVFLNKAIDKRKITIEEANLLMLALIGNHQFEWFTDELKKLYDICKINTQDINTNWFV